MIDNPLDEQEIQSRMEELYVQELFKLCRSKGELKQWIKTFLNIDLPDQTIDPNSNSNPMDFIYDVYQSALTGDPNKTTFVVAASRNSMKTLVASILEFILMLHFGRDIVHMAAILDQSLAAIRYLDKFLRLPAVQKYSKSDSKRVKELQNMPTALHKPVGYAKLQVIVATAKSANAQRASCLSGDTKVSVVTPHNRITQTRIQSLVNRFRKGESLNVLSLNNITGQQETKKVIAALKKKDILYELKLSDGTVLKATGDHKFCLDAKGTLENAKSVAELQVGDSLKKLTSYLENQTQWEDSFSVEDIITGSMLGDGCIYLRKKKPNGEAYSGNASFNMTKTNSVLNYCEWVTSRLSEKANSRISHNKRSGFTGEFTNVQVVSGQNSFWTDAYHHWYPNTGKKVIPSDLNLNLHSLAVWLMDDGGPCLRNITTASFSEEENLKLADKINELLGGNVADVRSYFHEQRQKSWQQIFLKTGTAHKETLMKLYQLVHPDYRYKLECEGTKDVHFLSDVTVVSKRILKENWVYDIEVEDNHNFFANGVSSRNCLIFDELDLIDTNILSEASFISDPDRTGKPPIFIYLSSRKSAAGPIQQKINEATNNPDSGIVLHKWSAVDFMKRCPDSVHKPEEPKITMYLHKENLVVATPDEYDLLPEEMKEPYDSISAFAGCRACPAFVVCQARAPEQKGTSVSLRDIGFIASTIRNASDSDKINAQVLNLKPESGGTVFNKFNRTQNVLKINQAWKFAFGVEPDRPRLKIELISELKSAGWRMHCGVDFGWVDTATGILIAYHKQSEKVIVLHCEASTGLSNPDWLAYVKEKIFNRYGFDLLCPDTADKSSPSTSAKLGMPARGTKPARIETGVSWLRSKIWNAAKQEVQLVVLDDPYNVRIMECFEGWQYKKEAMGFDFSSFMDDEFTHHLDALRYAIDPFIAAGVAVLSATQTDNNANRNAVNNRALDTAEGMKDKLRQHFIDEFNIDLAPQEEKGTSIDTGNISFAF